MRRREDDTSDERAVRRVLAGDRRAFAPLLERYRASLLRLCRRVLRSEAAAEDVAQEAALQAFLSLGGLREPRHFSAWLHSIAANLAYGALRRRGPPSLDPLIEEASLVDGSPRPEEVQAARELHDTVLAAMRELSDVNREAVVGYYLEGQSYAELAELLDVPVSTVKGRLYKGRRQLEPALTPVAREMFGRNRRREEKQMEVRETVEVTVDEVVRIAPSDQGWEEFSEVAKRMSEPYDLSSQGTPAAPAGVMLRETDGQRVLPIYVGMDQAFSIWLATTGGQSMRPMTHDLMRQIIENVGLRVRGATVNRLAEKTFYAQLSMSRDEKTYQVDARPSDAVALAVRLDAPIHASRPLFDEESLTSKQAWPDWHREQFGQDAP